MVEVLTAELRAGISGFERDLDQAAIAIRNFTDEANKGFDRTNASGRKLNKSTSDLTSTFRTLGAVIATLGLAKFTQDGLTLANQFTSINRTLVATTGGVRQAGEALEFVRQTSRRLGTDIVSGARAFSQLTNAAAGTQLEGEGIRRIFTGISEATLALGLNTDQYGRALLAVTQILNRGRVQTEELNQLTEAGIPIYKDLAAAIGITGQQLQDALQKGKVPAEALLVVSGQLSEKFRETADIASKSTAVAFSVLRSVTNEAIAEFFQAILRSDELNAALRRLTTQVIDFKNSLNVEEIERFINALVKLVDTLARLGGQDENVSGQFAITLEKNTASLLQRLGLTEKTAKSLANILIGANEESQTAFQGLTEGLSDVNTVLEAVVGQKIEIEALDDAWADFGETVEDTIPTVKKAVDENKNLANELRDLILKPTVSIKDAAEEAFEAIKRRTQGEINATEELIKARLKIIDIIQREADAEDEASRRIIASIRRRLREEQDERATAQRGFDRIRRRAEDEQQRASDRAVALARRPIDQALNNIQDAFASTFSDILNGELNSVQDFADSMKRILFDTFAEIAASRIIGPAFENALADAGILTGERGATAGPGNGGLTAQGLIGAGALGTGAGFASSGILSQAGVGGTANGLVSGAIGGGVAGAQVGGPFGAAVGAGAGALIGSGFFELLRDFNIGLFGGGTGGRVAAGIIDPVQGLGDLFGVLSGGPKQSRLAVQTSAGQPGRGAESPIEGAFGFISLITDQSKRAAGSEVTQAVAQFDRAIAGLITERQRQLVSQTLQSPPNRTLIGQANADTDNALAEVIVRRARLVIQSLGGERVAQSVVGTLGSDTSQLSLSNIQSRVEEALGILSLIEEFKAGPTTEAADAIRAINDEFTNLISRAEEFQISTSELAAEQARRIAEVAAAVDRDVGQRILALTDPDAALEAALKERQRKEFENARDANANLTELERLHVLEREDLARRIEVANEDVADAADTLFDQVFEVLRGSLSPEGEIAQIFDDFIALATPLSRLGAENQQLVKEFERLIQAANLLGRSVSDVQGAFTQLSFDIRQQAFNDAQSIIDSLTSPFRSAQRAVADQLAEFARFVEEGILSPGIFSQLERIVTASARANEALRRLSGAASGPIEQVANAFDQFIRAGNPLSAAGQELFNLTETFINLKDAADLLGLSTAQLEGSFAQQAAALRARVLSDIDSQLAPRERELESIGQFLDSLQTGPEQPLAVRLQAASSQFERAQTSGSVSEVLNAANVLRDTARAQFGSASGFFAIENQIESALMAFREQEQSNIDFERRRLIEQAEREEQQISLGRDSLNTLIQVNSNTGLTVRGMGDLIVLARQQMDQNAEIQGLLEQVIARAV